MDSERESKRPKPVKKTKKEETKLKIDSDGEIPTKQYNYVISETSKPNIQISAPKIQKSPIHCEINYVIEALNQ